MSRAIFHLLAAFQPQSPGRQICLELWETMKLESDLRLFVFTLIHLYLHPLHHVISVKRGRLVYQTISVHLPALSVNIFCSSLPPNLSSLHMLPCFSAHPVCPAPKRVGCIVVKLLITLSSLNFWQ